MTVNALWLFLAVSWVGLQCVIGVFPNQLTYFFIIKSGYNYVRLNNHCAVFLYRCHVSASANGFQKFAILYLKMKFPQIFNTTDLFGKSYSIDPRNFNNLRVIHTAFFSILQLARGSD